MKTEIPGVRDNMNNKNTYLFSITIYGQVYTQFRTD